MYKAKGAKMGENDFIQIFFTIMPYCINVCTERPSVITGGPKIQRVKLYIPLFL